MTLALRLKKLYIMGTRPAWGAPFWGPPNPLQRPSLLHVATDPLQEPWIFSRPRPRKSPWPPTRYKNRCKGKNPRLVAAKKSTVFTDPRPRPRKSPSPWIFRGRGSGRRRCNGRCREKRNGFRCREKRNGFLD